MVAEQIKDPRYIPIYEIRARTWTNVFGFALFVGAICFFVGETRAIGLSGPFWFVMGFLAVFVAGSLVAIAGWWDSRRSGSGKFEIVRDGKIEIVEIKEHGQTVALELHTAAAGLSSESQSKLFDYKSTSLMPIVSRVWAARSAELESGRPGAGIIRFVPEERRGENR